MCECIYIYLGFLMLLLASGPSSLPPQFHPLTLLHCIFWPLHTLQLPLDDPSPLSNPPLTPHGPLEAPKCKQKRPPKAPFPPLPAVAVVTPVPIPVIPPATKPSVPRISIPNKKHFYTPPHHIAHHSTPDPMRSIRIVILLNVKTSIQNYP